MKKILVVGSSNTDLIIKVPEIPRPGETLLGGEFQTFPGGKGANQAVAAARAGGEVVLLLQWVMTAMASWPLRDIRRTKSIQKASKYAREYHRA